MSEFPVLDVKNLSVTLQTEKKQRKLVNNVSFSIAPRTVWGLIGESGSGKSLTCLSIMGLLPKGIRRTSGAVMLNGQLLLNLPADEMRSIRGRSMAMILQNPMSCFDSVFTIRRHFKETLESHNRRPDEEKIRESLIEVGFDNPGEILELYPFQMSGGMLQRVMVALALIMEAPLLIADEPTTDLDVVSQIRILNLLDGVRRKHGMSILLITHDLSVIARLADYAAVMRGGEIVETGSVTDIFNQCRHEYTRALMRAHYSLYGSRLERILGTSSGRYGAMKRAVA